MNLYTAGHSSGTLEDFIALLKEHGVELLADVRSRPRSRLAHFDLVPLQEAVEAAGISYRFLGDKLGGMPRDPRVAERWRQGRLYAIIVDHLRKTEEWQEGLAEVAALVRRGTSVCLMCSESDPNECHRKAVALDLAVLIDGLELRHIAVKPSGAPTEVGVQEVLL